MTRFHCATAYHEVGHVVGYCLLLDGIDQARVFPKGSKGLMDIDGRPISGCGGLTEGIGAISEHHYGPAISKYPPEWREALRKRGASDMVVQIMGPLSEARYTRASADAVMLTYGHDDMQRVDDIAAWLAADDVAARVLRNDAWETATQLVPAHWQKIVAVAEKLASVGVIQGDDALLETIEPAAPLIPPAYKLR